MIPELVTACVLGFASLLPNDGGTVRIHLFRLFEPQSVNVRVMTTSGATLSAGRLTDTLVNKDETVRIRRADSQLSISVVDAFGRIKQTVTTPELSLTPGETASFELHIPSKIRRLVRGNLVVSASAPQSRAALQVVLTARREAVIASVVAAELGANQPREAYKALAVVARTFLAAPAGRHEGEGFDFCDTTHCQLYRGEDDLLKPSTAAAIQQAVSETAGEMLRFHGETVEGYYTAVCGGLTATPQAVWGGATTGDYPYRAVACPWCAASHYSQWERHAEVSAVLAALSSAIGFRLSAAAEVAVQKQPSSDLVQAVIIRDRGRQWMLGTDEFRRCLGRRLGWNKVLSPTFRLERRANRFIFRGRGFGSQVGLCVAGATAQAASGRTYRDILDFYFPRTEVSSR